MINRRFFIAVLVLIFLFGNVLPAAAQTGSAGDGGDGNQDTGVVNVANDPSLVNQVVNPDGSINYSGMTDLGAVSISDTSYMPDIPGIGPIDATYHEYMTESGALVLIPTVATDLCLRYGGGLTSGNIPDGYYNAGTPITIQMGADYSNGIDITLSPGGSVSLPNTGGYYTGGSGSTLEFDPINITSSTLGDYNNLTATALEAQLLSYVQTQRALFHLSVNDILSSGKIGDVYAGTTILIYTDCSKSLVGCPPAYTAAVAARTPDVVDIPVQCPPPYTTTGPIQISGGPGAGDGGKLAPLHPVVVGQDPQRRGVDIQAWASIPPIIYHYYEAVPRTDTLCIQDDRNGSYGTGCLPTNRLFRLVTRRTFDCINHTQVYTDQLGSAAVSLSLTQGSRQWILTSLAEAYPGAHLLHPDFSLSVPGPGSVSGNTVTWLHVFPGIPIQDPGYWMVTVRVNTTGTPVSGPRFASQGLGTFLDEMVRVTLVDGMGGIQP
jgi:hypothetical protein